MTIEKGRDLLNQSSPSAKELKISIAALKQEMEDVQNCIEIGFRERTAGEATVREFSDILNKLEEKLRGTK